MTTKDNTREALIAEAAKLVAANQDARAALAAAYGIQSK